MAGEELERWRDLEVDYFDVAARIALSDAEFAIWRASANKGSSPPAQNPGGLLLEETSALPVPVTNTDDSGETTPPPSLGSEEKTTSGGNIGDDATLW